MANCYSCKQILNALTSSWEHIIPNALGGSLKSRRLLCRACNEKAGKLIDKALVNFCAPLIHKYGVIPDRGITGIKKTAGLKKIPSNSSTLIEQAIIKICTNFYVFKFKTNPPSSNVVCNMEYLGIAAACMNHQPYHSIFLYGSTVTRKLTACVELFGEVGFLVQFSDQYTGPSLLELVTMLPNSKTGISSVAEIDYTQALDFLTVRFT